MSANGGQADVVLVYDDVTRIVSQVLVRNDGDGTYTAELHDNTTGGTVFGPETRTAASGSSVTVTLGSYSVDSVSVNISWSA